jgi:hypothetical protein
MWASSIITIHWHSPWGGSSYEKSLICFSLSILSTYLESLYTFPYSLLRIFSHLVSQPCPWFLSGYLFSSFLMLSKESYVHAVPISLYH